MHIEDAAPLLKNMGGVFCFMLLFQYMKNRFSPLFFPLAVIFTAAIFPQTAAATYGDVSTFVSKIYDGDGLVATKAYLDNPSDMVVDDNGNFYLADTLNNVIRQIDSNQIISTVAGTGSYGYVDGDADASEFGFPEALALASDGTIYVADTDNHAIRKIKNGQVTTISDDNWYYPKGILVSGSTLYVADTGHDSIKKINLSNNSVTTIAEDLNSPTKMVKSNSNIYFANTGQQRVLKLDLDNLEVSTVATGFLDIGGLAVIDDTLYVVDGDGLFDYIRQVDLDTGDKDVIAEDPHMETLNGASGIVKYGEHIYVANKGGSSVYRFDLDGSDPLKYAGKRRFQSEHGTGDEGLVGRPKELVLSPKKKWIYFTENNKIRRIRRSTGEVQALVGNVVDNYAKKDTREYVGGAARFSDPTGIVVSPNGKKLYVVDRNNNRIRYVRIKDKAVGYITGAGYINSTNETDNGYAEGVACPDEQDIFVTGCAYFNRPTALAISPDGKYLYVADSSNNMIRRVVARGPNKGKTKLIAGQLEAGFVNGIKGSAQFNGPVGVTINAKGTVLFVADRGNHVIRKIRLRDSKVTTYIGSGDLGYLEAAPDSAQLSYPEFVKFGADKNVYWTEVGGQRVRVYDKSSGVTKLVAGAGERGFQNGDSTTAEFNNPKGMAITAKQMYVADNFNDVIRKIDIELVDGQIPYSEPAPVVEYTSPNRKAIGDSESQTVDIKVGGQEFRYGAVVYFGSYKVTAFVNSDTSITARIPIGQMDPGYYEVKVINSDGQADSVVRAFAVSEADGTVPVVDYFAP